MQNEADHVTTDNAGPPRVQRRLAAILVADVVGYSRMMRADETDTLARLMRLRRELVDPKLDEYGGRMVKSTGDGMLADFPSAVDAVQYAIEVQKEIASASADLPPETAMLLRIGINVGDVILEGDDIYGDGVNVAARLEGVAPPGGICLSATVHDQVSNKLDLSFDDSGLQMVKNISEPIRTYSWRVDGTHPAPDSGARRTTVTDAPSIAVLPFNNMSGDPEQDYFSDGITEDIITDLSKVSGLFVIARNSSFTYKGRAVDVKEVARELGVRHVLEGSVRKAGNRLRITAQLIDGASGGHVWAERYDRVLEDIFEIQDEITLSIVNELKVRLDLLEKDRLSCPPSHNVEAYDLVLRGRDHLLAHASRTGMEEASAMFERARALDAKCSPAYSGLAFANIMSYTNDWTQDPDKTLEYAVKMARTAVEVGPKDALARRALAVALLWNREIEAAWDELKKASELSPGDAELLAVKGNMLVYLHEPDHAITCLEKAIKHSPHHSSMWLYFLGHAYFMKGDFETAERYLKKRIEAYPETDIARVMLASCCGYQGQDEEAGRLWDEVMQVNPGYSLEQKSRVLPYKDPGDWDYFVAGLTKAGLPK
ncbi:adenylate/guanylate cyclase domain-containing protein [Mesorhizobium xinjiangense]|uniref:adenylate/guanylate cyclase domain-containing protein n=1 Tax=Mesorhizobium xinjiangense TaxID=2678685 RepID=UPI0012ECCA0E|nr:adenylate/guanylate cyclase domain-containing protein [Mesorhizobium xinjiangense]